MERVFINLTNQAIGKVDEIQMEKALLKTGIPALAACSERSVEDIDREMK